MDAPLHGEEREVENHVIGVHSDAWCALKLLWGSACRCPKSALPSLLHIYFTTRQFRSIIFVAKESKYMRAYRTFKRNMSVLQSKQRQQKICFKRYWLFWEIKFICHVRISVEFHKEMRGGPPCPRPPSTF